MQIIDNFLEEGEFIRLKNVILHPQFLWEYNPNTATNDDPEDLLWNTKFTHLAFEDYQKQRQLVNLIHCCKTHD